LAGEDRDKVFEGERVGAAGREYLCGLGVSNRTHSWHSSHIITTAAAAKTNLMSTITQSLQKWSPVICEAREGRVSSTAHCCSCRPNVARSKRDDGGACASTLRPR
jgi:hypothetical protein